MVLLEKIMSQCVLMERQFLNLGWRALFKIQAMRVGSRKKRESGQALSELAVVIRTNMCESKRSQNVVKHLIGKLKICKQFDKRIEKYENFVKHLISNFVKLSKF